MGYMHLIKHLSTSRRQLPSHTERMTQMDLMEIEMMILKMIGKNKTVLLIAASVLISVVILLEIYYYCYVTSFFLFRVEMIWAFPANVHDPIEIPTPNIDTLIPDGIILEIFYVLPVHLQVC